jgi:capsular exopolysaccharide synthesis family protein
MPLPMRPLPLPSGRSEADEGEASADDRAYLAVMPPGPAAMGRGLRLGTGLHTEAPLTRYWQMLRRRWVTGALLFAVIVGGVSVGAGLQTPTYRASALLEIRRDSTAAVPVEALFSADKIPTDELETQYGILRSRTLAERVLMDVSRYRTAGTPRTDGPGDVAEAPAGTAGSTTRRPGTEAVDSFLGTLVVNPQRGSRLVELQFVSKSPRLAAFTVNSVLDNYLAMRMDEAQRSARWLEEQISETQRRLEGAERRIQAYVRRHGIPAIETGRGETAQVANDRLTSLRDALSAAQAERMDRQSMDEETRRAASAGVDSPVAQQLTVRLADLRREHAKLASTFKEDYPAVKATRDQIRELEQALSEETRMVIARGQRQYLAARGKEDLLRKALDEQGAIVRELSEGSAGDPGYEALKRELVTNQAQFASLGDKLKEVRISAALKAANVGVIDRATTPSEPDGMPLPLTVILAAMVGLVVASGGMVLREQFDTSVRSFTDVESHFGVRPLAAIPAVEGTRARGLPASGTTWNGRVWRRIDEHGPQRSALADAFAALRNAVLLREGEGASSRVLLITSAQSAEGKTTIAVNLALSLARLKYRVLLVDANMRFPCIQRALGLPDRLGLVDHLASGVDWRSCLHAGVRANLDVLAGSQPQTSPADLLSMPAMGAMLDQAAAQYDYVVIDAPAVLPHVADVRSLEAVSDSVLFAVRHGFTPRESVTLALSQLERVAGVVLNRSESGEIAFGEPDSLQEQPAAS